MTVRPSLLGACKTLGRRARALIVANAAAAYGMVGRMWVILTGPMTILLLTHYFTPVLQGYFFMFMSLALTRSLAELGMGQVIIVRVARAIHGSTDQADLNARVNGLVRYSAKWFTAAGVLAGLVLATLGTVLLGSRAGLPRLEWLPAWLAVSAMVAADIALAGLMFPLEGAGSVRPVYLCRMIRSFVNSAVLWLCILAGLELWCVPVALAASLAWTVMFLLSKEARLVSDALRPGVRAAKIAWRREILPSQWRLALSSVAEFFTFYTLTPFIYITYGPVVAGQLGLTWQIGGAISAVAGAILSARFPEFSRLAASGSARELHELMFSTTITTLAFCLLGVLAFGGGVFLLTIGGFQIVSRLLPLPELAILLAGNVIWGINLPVVCYLRAHGSDPFLPAALGGAVLMAATELTLGRWFGVFGLLSGYVLVGACFMVPVGAYLLHRKRIECGYPTLAVNRVHLLALLPTPFWKRYSRRT